MRSLRRTLSLRARIAATVVAAAVVLLSLTGLFVVRVVDARMHDNVRAEALRALDDAIAQIRNGGSVGVVVTTRVGEPRITVSVEPRPATNGPIRPTEGVGQTRADRSSWEVVGETSVERRMVDETPVYEASSLMRGAAGDITLVATAPLAETERTIRALRWGLAITVPALALLLGAISALVTTRALRPVAKMRAEADAIADGTFHRRLTPTDRSPELAELADTMNEMIERLERSATRQRQFASDVSHEFRSPLATIRGTLELTARHPEAAAEAAPPALGEIDRLDSLVDDLLTLARLDERAVARDEIDLDDIITEQVRASAGNRIAIVVAIEAVRVIGDRRALTGLVRNLLDNAVRHAVSEVSVSLRADHELAVITVDDDGSGIAHEDRERVFERFARLDLGRTRSQGGTGLGLAVVAATVANHHGSIVVDDSPGGGARFTVALPKATE